MSIDEKRQYSRYDKECIRDRINSLSLEGKSEIFRIISQAEKYSENKSNILFDIAKINYETLVLIEKFLVFSETNSKELADDEEERDKYRSSIAS